MASSASIRSAAVVVFAGLLGCDAEPTGVDRNAGDVCEQAAQLVVSCGGDAVDIPVEGCVGDFETVAQDIVDGGCEALAADGGKSDATGLWCTGPGRWLGLCGDTISLADAARLSSMDDVCDGRDDALCQALREGDVASMRDAARILVAGEDREHTLRDPALRFYLRERMMGLLAFDVIDRSTPGPDYPDAVDAVLSEHFVAYEPEQFEIAHEFAPPVPLACGEKIRAAVLLFPGVVRLTDRDEFREQRDALESALPCVETVLVDTGSFIDPAVNAEQALAVFEEVDRWLDRPAIHLVGYSQGSSNALRTLVDSPAIAERTVSVFGLNSAAHGSEVADTLAGLLVDVGCDILPEFAAGACAWAAERSVTPGGKLLDVLARAMGVPVDDLADFVEDEAAIVGGDSLADFLRAHRPGVESLGTSRARDFWTEHGDDLPRSTLYYSFRSVISQPDANLPSSNALFFSMLEQVGGQIPYNDMQVRLDNQSYGGPIADLEIEGPVAEGNHWQWELTSGALPEAVMPASMTDRIPHRALMVAYFQTLAEVGLLVGQ